MRCRTTFNRNLTRGFRFNVNYTWSHTIDDVVGFFKDYQNENEVHGRAGQLRPGRTAQFHLRCGLRSRLPEMVRKRPELADRRVATGHDNSSSHGPPGDGDKHGRNIQWFLQPSGRRSRRKSILSAVRSAELPVQRRGVHRTRTRDVRQCRPQHPRGPRFAQVDASLSKATKLSETMSLQLRLDVFNLLDRANYADPSGGISCNGSVGSCSSFGKSISTVGNLNGGLLGFGGPRQIQLSARLNF